MARHRINLLVLLLLGAVVAALPTGPAAGQATQGSERVYDYYVKGVHLAEFTVHGPPGSRPAISVRRKDMWTARWGDPVRVPAGREGDASLEVGPLGDVARLVGASAVDWGRYEAVGWPDGGHVYRRHRIVSASVDGRPAQATHWAVPDRSNPVDLIIGAGDTLAAAVFPGGDQVLVRRGHEDFTRVGEWLDPDISPAIHGVRELADVTMRAGDGTRLATRVFLPDGPDAIGPFPSIFVRTPYGITNLPAAYLTYATRGFALVLQSTRGRTYWETENRSEGEWTPLVDEASDGADALDWIVDQAWSDGQICMEGGSYVAYTQWTATIAANPALKCLIPESSMGTPFSDQPYRGGGFVEGLAYYVFWMLDKPILPDRTWSDILRHRPLIDIDRYATGEDLPEWNAFFEHWLNDAYWQPVDWYRAPGPRDFATLQISGWWDDDLTGTQSNWDLMARSSERPQRLILGPWKHGYNQDRSLNGFDFGVTAIRDDIWLLKQKWYDRFLKGVDNGVDHPVAEYFLLGANEWRSAAAWPPPDAEPLSFYLQSDGEAARFTHRGHLTAGPPEADQPPDEYVYDPAHAAPNWRSFDLMERWEDVQRFPYDFKDIEARPDVATFTTEPLSRDLVVAGTIEVDLYASTDVLDTDWWVHLSDVYPDNSSVRLSTGMLRARFRDLEDPIHQAAGVNFEGERLLSGDIEDVERYRFSIPAVANLFRSGHRLRIAVMNAQDNYVFPNSNTGEDEGRVTTSVPGRMRIHHDSDHPSRVIVRVLPR